jgi:hypothetical protein
MKPKAAYKSLLRSRHRGVMATIGNGGPVNTGR